MPARSLSTGDFLLGRYLLATVEPNALKLVSAALAALASYLFPDRTWVTLLVVVVFVALDLATGICASWLVGERIESKRLKRTAGKLLIYVGLVAVSSLLPAALHESGTVEVPLELRRAVVGGTLAYLAGTEALSLLENARKAGFPVPEALLKFVEGRVPATPANPENPE